jgi:hypothetical protein
MAEDAVTVTHVFPCGTATLPVPGGEAVTCRVTTGHLDAEETGLIEEMRRRRKPVPWRSEAVRGEALATIEARADLDGPTREGLLRHVRNSPYYEGL